jgi:hypothetical protein
VTCLGVCACTQHSSEPSSSTDTALRKAGITHPGRSQRRSLPHPRLYRTVDFALHAPMAPLRFVPESLLDIIPQPTQICPVGGDLPVLLLRLPQILRHPALESIPQRHYSARAAPILMCPIHRGPIAMGGT